MLSSHFHLGWFMVFRKLDAIKLLHIRKVFRWKSTWCKVVDVGCVIFPFKFIVFVCRWHPYTWQRMSITSSKGYILSCSLHLSDEFPICKSVDTLNRFTLMSEDKKKTTSRYIFFLDSSSDGFAKCIYVTTSSFHVS